MRFSYGRAAAIFIIPGLCKLLHQVAMTVTMGHLPLTLGLRNLASVELKQQNGERRRVHLDGDRQNGQTCKNLYMTRGAHCIMRHIKSREMPGKR